MNRNEGHFNVRLKVEGNHVIVENDWVECCAGRQISRVEVTAEGDGNPIPGR